MTTAAPDRATVHLFTGARRHEQLHVEMNDGSIWVYAADGTVTHHQPPAGHRWQLSHSNLMAATDGTRATICADGTLDEHTPHLAAPPDTTTIRIDGGGTWAADRHGDLWLHDPAAGRGRWERHATNIATTAVSPGGQLLTIDRAGQLHSNGDPTPEPALDGVTVTDVAFLYTRWAALDSDQQVWFARSSLYLAAGLPHDRPAIFDITQIAGDEELDYLHLVTIDTAGILAHRRGSDPTVTTASWHLDLDDPHLLCATARGALLADTDNTLWVTGPLGRTTNTAPTALGRIGSPELELLWALAASAPTGTPLADLIAATDRLT